MKTALLTGLAIGSNLHDAYGLEKVVNNSKQTQTNLKEKKQLTTYELLKSIKLEESIGFVKACKKHTPFKEQIKKHGFDKTAKHVAKLKSYSIDIANKYSEEKSKQIPQGDYIKASIQIGMDELNFHKGHTKPANKDVISARAKTIEIATKNSRKILSKVNKNKVYENKNLQQQYYQLIKKTFTKQEYTEYCEQMANTMDEYYESLGKTLGLKIIFGKKHIEKAKQESRKGYFLTLEKVYGKEK